MRNTSSINRLIRVAEEEGLKKKTFSDQRAQTDTNRSNEYFKENKKSFYAVEKIVWHENQAADTYYTAR